jgi:hypothetical protein
MAIGYSSEPVHFAANPKIHKFTGVEPGSKATFIYTVIPQQEDPATTQYTETFYRYADPNGVIEFDERPLRQRGAAAMYESPTAPTIDWLWWRNLCTYFEGNIECNVQAAEGDDYEGEITNYFIWGGTNILSMVNDYSKYIIDPFSPASRALTKATTIDVNKYLPSFLLFKIENATGYGAVTLTASKGATSNALATTGVNGQINTQYLATTYAEGDWALRRTDGLWWSYGYEQRVYTLKIKNDLCAKELVDAGEAVYLRWLNSLGGYSFGLFEVRSQSVAVQTNVRSRDYRFGLAGSEAPVILQSDVETLSKPCMTSLAIGRGMVGWDQFEDLEDLSTSIEVLRWYPTAARWIPVQISGGSNGDRSKQYNDFSCVLTMPQSFTQIR